MRTFDTPGPITATVEVAIGHVRIRAGDRDTTVVEVHPSDAANEEDVRGVDQMRVELADGRLLVKGPQRAGMLLVRSWLSRSWGGSVDVTIELPAGSDLDATLGSADLHADGPLGACRVRAGLGHVRLDEADTVRVKSGWGNIVLEHANGHVDVTTGSGEVRLRDLGGTAAVRNANGDTWIGTTSGELRLQAANGSITVDRALAGVGAKSANGSICLGEIVRGSVVLETQMGDLEVGVREGTAAWLDAKARAGTVRNELDAADSPDASAETVEVRARTSVGEILVRRPTAAPDAP